MYVYGGSGQMRPMVGVCFDDVGAGVNGAMDAGMSIDKVGVMSMACINTSPSPHCNKSWSKLVAIYWDEESAGRGGNGAGWNEIPSRIK